MKMARISLLLLVFGCVSVIHAEDLLFFCGGRLWGAGHLMAMLKPSGCSVKLVDSMHLAGLGGTSLKKFPSDPEPVPEDGITPEFARLSDYKLVMFNAIPVDCLKKLLTPERVDQLREYVKAGGHLLLNSKAPASLGDLLPVEFEGPMTSPKNTVSNRPSLPAFKSLPAQWPKFGNYRPARAKKGTTAYCAILTKNTPLISVGIASMPYGKGKVWFYNGDWLMQATNQTSFCHWAYSTGFMAALISEAMEVPLAVEKTILNPPPRPEQTQLDTVEYTLNEVNSNVSKEGTISLNGSQAELSNGIIVKIKENSGDLEIRFPGVKTTVAANIPKLQFSGNPQALNGDGSEAIVKNYNLKDLKVDWKLLSKDIQDNKLTVTYEAENSLMKWEIIPGKMVVDGREYIGYAERVVMMELPTLVESLVFNSRVPVGKIRRLTCYTTPRGYLEGQVGENDIKDTKIWQFFTSGQPFTYSAVPEGIFIDMVDAPIPCYASFTARKQGDERMNRTLRVLLGRKKTPVEMPFIWHWFSKGPENGNNDYIGVYQFVRSFLREQCGIKSFPQVTEACCYLHTRSMESIEKTMAVAEALNFKAIWLSLCPLAMEKTSESHLGNIMKLARKHGMIPHPWTAGGYGHGNKQPVFVAHPEWFIRKKDGTFYKYFNKHSVLDLNMPEAREWYLGIMKKTQSNGMGRIYIDMGGQVASNVNYFTPEASPNLEGLISIFQEYSKMDLPFSVEGMNPLAKDQALFNPAKAYPLLGKEFAYVGACPLASIDDGIGNALHLDYFRLGMFNASINIDVDGIVNNFERVPNERKYIEQIGRFNLVINKANDHVPTPFVRETPFGTSWMGDKTGALFFYHPVKELKLTLPEGWHVVDNASLKDIPEYSVILLSK